MIGALACTPNADDDDGPNPPVDAGTKVDTGVVENDAGTPVDAGPADTGIDLTPDPTCQGTWVVLVNGRLTTESGGGIEAKAQVCIRINPSNNQLCLRPADSDSNGDFTVTVPLEARCTNSMVMRAVKPLTSYAASYCDVPVSASSGSVLNLPEEVALYETTMATTLPPEGQGDQARSVVFADGLEMDVTPDEFRGDYSMIGSKRIGATDPRPCFLPQGENYDGVIALAPEEDVVDVAFPVRIPNDTGLAPGATVDLFVLGGLSCKLVGSDEQLEEGLWHNYGTATVNGAGTFIEGGDVPCFNWFGYKAQ